MRVEIRVIQLPCTVSLSASCGHTKETNHVTGLNCTSQSEYSGKSTQCLSMSNVSDTITFIKIGFGRTADAQMCVKYVLVRYVLNLYFSSLDLNAKFSVPENRYFFVSYRVVDNVFFHVA